MEQKAFDHLKKSKDSWWWKGRSYAVSRVLKRFVHTAGKEVLDMGAGFGSMYEILASYGKVSAFDTYPEAAEFCKVLGYKEVYASQEALAIQKGSFDVIGAFDVIEHIEDDATAVRGLHQLLTKDGLLIATVPAYQFLWSEHDVEHHHFRRYTKGSMRKLLSDAGFRVVYIGYWNCTLLPVAYVLRKLGRGGGDDLVPSAPINAALTFLLWIESRFMPLLSLPFGISVIVVARRL